jgi:hypothetical protein
MREKKNQEFYKNFESLGNNPIKNNSLNNIKPISNKFLEGSSKGNLSKSVINSLKSEKLRDSIAIDNEYSKLLPRGKALRISTPYIPNPKKEYQEYLKNKGKWLIKKGFEVNFTKMDVEKQTIIPNYVFMSPPKIPLYKHQFRDVEKDKWINKNSFVYRNPHDLVL